MHTGLESKATPTDPVLPLKLYGAEFSYFTGKLEGVLRFMELPHRRFPGGPTSRSTLRTGVAQIPSLELADGRVLTDSTPIIAWLDERYPDRQIIPRDPLLGFLSRLIEDYADEWLWRPAMHYRWNYTESAKHLARVLVSEHAHELPLPLPQSLLARIFTNRQRSIFLKEDGVSPETYDHVEETYHASLRQLSAIFETRPYLLGERPSLADFGFFGPMFRHFAQDPTPARIMRETAPAVHEWTARMWNARHSKMKGGLLESVPDDWSPILKTIGSAYLPALVANAEAWTGGAPSHDVDVEGVRYRNLRTSPYRVWCLEKLQHHYASLPPLVQEDARKLLEAHGCWAPLWRVTETQSGVDPDGALPFDGGQSMTGVPREKAEKFYWFPESRVRRRSD